LKYLTFKGNLPVLTEKIKLVIAAVFISLFFPCIVKASPEDSIQANKLPVIISIYNEQDFKEGRIQYTVPDSTILHTGDVNPAIPLHYNYLSIPGSAGDPMLFKTSGEIFSYGGIRSFDLYLLLNSDIRYYRTNKKFTEVKYHTGAFREQHIGVFHTQNITKNWNAGLHFDRTSVKDFMNFSDTYRGYFGLFTSLESKNNRYHLFSHGLWNAVKNQVNGGLVSDSLFDNTDVPNLGLKGLAYQLSDAVENYKTRNFYLSQYYDLFKKINDSLKVPAFRIQHSISYEKKQYVYADETPDSTFYSNFFFDTKTNDTLICNSLKNAVSFILPADEKNNAAFFRNWATIVSAEHQHFNYEQRRNLSWENIAVGADIKTKTDSARYGMRAVAKYILYGHDVNSYSGEFRVNSPLFSFGQYFASVTLLSRQPDMIYKITESNNFIWVNNFGNISLLAGTIGYSLPSVHLKAGYIHNTIKNYVFMNESARPDQANEDVNVEQFYISKNFNFHSFHFGNTIYFQSANNKNLIHIPTIVSQHSLYIQKRYFKKILLTAYGLNIYYNSSYYANAFMPSNALFFLQDEKKTGGYPLIDLFLNVKLKGAKFFLKMENIADGIYKKSYYYTPHYPQPGRVLKFGVSWSFYD
jgi:hypothetical protein